MRLGETRLGMRHFFGDIHPTGAEPTAIETTTNNHEDISRKVTIIYINPKWLVD